MQLYVGPHILWVRPLKLSVSLSQYDIEWSKCSVLTFT